MDTRFAPAAAAGNGSHHASRTTQLGHRAAKWSSTPMGDGDPGGNHGSMPGNPLDKFDRSAESAGYPALLIVAMISLALVVVPVALLGLTRSGWVLALALVTLQLALALLAAAIGAAFDDGDSA
jgi:hypothetical protein